MAKGIPVLEIFGPTIQGEGMVIGRKRCSSGQPAAIIPAAGVTPLSLGTGLLKRYSLDDGGGDFAELKDIGETRFLM